MNLPRLWPHDSARRAVCVAALTFLTPGLDPNSGAGGAFAQTRNAPAKPPDKAAPAQTFERLSESLKVIDWDTEQVHLVKGLDNMWRDNGWNDESDRFAHDLACRVSKIPPWQPMERLRAVTDISAERYGLSPEAKARLNAMITTETGAFLMRHAVPIVSQTREYLQVRAKGQPVDAQQVAQWAKDGGPVLDDLHRSLDRMIGQFESTLDPRQKAILERDRKSYLKRRASVEEAMKRWAAGEWEASDWGMQDDPIQNGLGLPASPPPTVTDQPAPAQATAPTAPAPTAPLRWYDHDPETWKAFILEAQERYGLDPGQRVTADSIEAETYQRAVLYRDRNRAKLNVIPVSERGKHADYEPIRTLFGELRGRVDALLTSTQRDRAAAKDRPAKAGAKPKSSSP